MNTSGVIKRGPNDYSIVRGHIHFKTSLPSLELDIQCVTAQHNGYEALRADAVDATKMDKVRAADVPKTKDKSKLSDFKLLTTLGTGTFARVWLVTPAKPVKSKNSPQLYALKILRKANVIKLRQCEHTRSERLILKRSRNHPFITRFIESWSDWDSLYILLEYAPGGELFSYLRKALRFPISTTRFYGAEIASVFAFLHYNGVIYRDLKPENVMLDARGHIRLVDFGFSKIIGNSQTFTLCGTPEYIAPEILLSNGHGRAVDWWALGIFIFELACGYPPFFAQTTDHIYAKILRADLQFPESPEFPEDFKSIVRGLCTKDPAHRLGSASHRGDDVKAHPFFKDIDWDELESTRHPGPIIPDIKHAGDTSHFDAYPPPEPQNPDDYTIAMYDRFENYFRDF